MSLDSTLLQPLPEGEVGHDTGVLDTHVCNRVGGVVVVVVGLGDGGVATVLLAV